MRSSRWRRPRPPGDRRVRGRGGDQAAGAARRAHARRERRHWHYLGFDRHELRRAGDFALLVRDRKSGFCIADHWGTAIGVAHGPPRVLGDCDQFHPEARAVEEGSSIGYTDRYPANFHGQNLDVTHVSAGRYWLVHRANSDFHLRDEHHGDDADAPVVTPLRACLKERCP